MEVTNKKQRTIVYIDGFNLYFGLVNSNYKNCKWLNLLLLSQNIIKPYQTLEKVKYFTSRVTNNSNRTRKQNLYLEAIATTEIEVYFGHYLKETIICRECNSERIKYNEKMTDVNIATHLLLDTYQDNYDTAILITGDSDLVPPIESISKHFPNKKIVVAFPPKRHSINLKNVASAYFTLGEKVIKHSQFPDKLTNIVGYEIEKPKEWI